VNANKQRMAVVAGQTAALIALDLIINWMRSNTAAGGGGGGGATQRKHPLLAALVAELVAEMSEAMVHQRRRAAIAIERAVAAEELPSQLAVTAEKAVHQDLLPAQRPEGEAAAAKPEGASG
jgi:hypothetical protein